MKTRRLRGHGAEFFDESRRGNLAITGRDQFLHFAPVDRRSSALERYPAVPSNVRRTKESSIGEKSCLFGLPNLYGNAELATVRFKDTEGLARNLKCRVSKGPCFSGLRQCHAKAANTFQHGGVSRLHISR